MDSTPTSLSTLPEELLAHILERCDSKSLLAVRATNHQMHRLCQPLAPRFAERLFVRVEDDAQQSETQIKAFAAYIQSIPHDSFLFAVTKDIILVCTTCRHRCRCTEQCYELFECQFFLDISTKSISILRSLVHLFTQPVLIIERLSADCSQRVNVEGKHGLPPCAAGNSKPWDRGVEPYSGPLLHHCYRPWIGFGPRDLETAFTSFNPSAKGGVLEEAGRYHFSHAGFYDRDPESGIHRCVERWVRPTLKCVGDCSGPEEGSEEGLEEEDGHMHEFTYMIWRIVGPWHAKFLSFLCDVQNGQLRPNLCRFDGFTLGICKVGGNGGRVTVRRVTVQASPQLASNLLGQEYLAYTTLDQ
ncbi:hypothetical protein HDV00_000627 [Rhizophlyctis rosea]|nr:hypothetical protein HDV00_000627 [Rhizophlyctis rosea]